MVNGVLQRPIEGVSMAYSFNDATAADRPRDQYFEMFGNRGIYHKGWTAVTKHRTPWETGQVKTIPFEEDVWELYDTSKDWSQAKNLAKGTASHAAKAQQLWLIEAAKVQRAAARRPVCRSAAIPRLPGVQELIRGIARSSLAG
jgi:arylsulfatase